MSEIEIDESKQIPARTIVQRLTFSLYAVILGIVLAQVFLWSNFKIGNFLTGNSIVLLFSNIYFHAYLLVFAVIGWISGRDFIDWIKNRIDDWDFW